MIRILRAFLAGKKKFIINQEKQIIFGAEIALNIKVMEILTLFLTKIMMTSVYNAFRERQYKNHD